MGALILLGGLLAPGAGAQPPPDTAADTGVPDTAADTGAPDTAADTAAPEDTGLDIDADGDGWTPRAGDCDDTTRKAYPGLAEVCSDRIDNDCDGLYDEACDDAARFASLRGGGGCTGNSPLTGTRSAAGPAALVLILPLWSFWWRRRR